MKTKAMLVLVMFLVTSCAAVTGEVTKLVGNDLQRQSEIAAKYGKKDVQQCADFLLSALGRVNADQAGLDELLKEETAGILSSALKAVLVKEYIARLNDPVKADAFKKEFDTNCRSMAGQILLDIVRDASKFGARR